MPEPVEDLVVRLSRIIPKRGVTAAARELGIRPSYLHDLLKGKKTNPGKALRIAMERYAVSRESEISVQSALSSSERVAEKTARNRETGEDPTVFESDAHRRLHRLLDVFRDDELTAVEDEMRDSILGVIARHRAARTKTRGS